VQWGGAVDVHVIGDGQRDLLEVVGALGAAGGRLHGRQQERDQYGDDGDDDQQLDQGEAALLAHGILSLLFCGLRVGCGRCGRPVRASSHDGGRPGADGSPGTALVA
jgi:hypothetical protein